MTELYIDTNVILDFVQRRDPFFYGAVGILRLRKLGRVRLYASALSMANAAYALRKQDPTVTRTTMRATIKALQVIALDGLQLSAAFNEFSAFTDIEDAMQHAAALRAGAEVIITRNPKDFAPAILPVMTPTQFLAQHAAAI